ncbi:SprT family zinc-dependent metalloprotease [Bacillus sp. CGMCC 1.16541]|uniref:M48 family metallopeptidase n=1 Tax=Bacillus sp. CGMCC 1.16541 TaxID=2185143 RepID=UPI000D7381D6|nr:SprT family zinc-dependent metalloprotease [Bacillus sp. CGMCC 1.16541]
MNHTYLGETIRFEITYKNRKSIGISIDSYGDVHVSAPKKTSDEQVINVLESNWDAILQKVNEVKARFNGPEEKVYENDEHFLYLGKSYPINIRQDSHAKQDYVSFDGAVLHITAKHLDNEALKQSLKRFYYQQTKALVEESIASYQHHFKTKPRSIKITDSPTTWGTCDSNLRLTFNWKLAMAPRDVLDYVVVHEMCHMVHLNHDRSFWRLVGKIMPDYKDKERWLALSNWKMTV